MATEPDQLRRLAEPSYGQACLRMAVDSYPLPDETGTVGSIAQNLDLCDARSVRPVHWIRAAQKAVESFPGPVKVQIASDLAIVAAGANPDTVKPLKGFVEGVFEIVTNDRSGTYRTVYALKLENAVWVVHAWQKKSTTGIKTAPHDIDLIRKRIARLNEELR